MKRRLLFLVAVAALSAGVVLVPDTAGAQESLPSVNVFMGPKFRTTNSVVGFFWPPGSTVTMQIDSPNGSIEYSASTTTDANGEARFQSGGPFPVFSIAEGDVVRLSDTTGDVAQTTVRYLTLTTLDPATDTIAGTARPDAEVHIFLGGPPSPNPLTEVAVVTADSAGNWSVNLTDTGHQLAEGDVGLVGIDHTGISWVVRPTSQWLGALEGYTSFVFPHNTGVYHVLTGYVTRAENLLAQGKTSAVCAQTKSLYQPIQAFQRSGAETAEDAWQFTLDVSWILVSLSC